MIVIPDIHLRAHSDQDVTRLPERSELKLQWQDELRIRRTARSGNLSRFQPDATPPFPLTVTKASLIA